MNNRLSALCKLGSGAVASVIGCGGKTSCIELLAQENVGKKVLITPTTKLYLPRCKGMVCTSVEECAAHIAVDGIQYFGIENIKTNKLEALPPTFLTQIYQQYDIVLLEADGSKGLPCKGWKSFEPVILPFTTHTIGILPISLLGKHANEKNVHRLGEFLHLTGLQENDIINIESIFTMLFAAQGMFAKSMGEKIFFLNGVESKEQQQKAEELLLQIQQRLPFQMALIYGSIHKKQFFALRGAEYETDK